MTTGFQLPRSPRHAWSHNDHATPPSQSCTTGLRPGTVQTLVAPRQTVRQGMPLFLRVVLLRDASSSMSGGKAREASEATDALFRELRGVPAPAQVQCAVIDFNGDAQLIQPLELVAACPEHLDAIRPYGATNIHDALRLADQTLTPHHGAQDVVVLFSDGQASCGGDPVPAAQSLKQRGVLILTVAYGKDADLETLQALATSSRHCYQRAVGANALHQFMTAVGRTLTHTITHGADPNQTLANL